MTATATAMVKSVWQAYFRPAAKPEEAPAEGEAAKASSVAGCGVASLVHVGAAPSVSACHVSLHSPCLSRFGSLLPSLPPHCRRWRRMRTRRRRRMMWRRTLWRRPLPPRARRRPPPRRRLPRPPGWVPWPRRWRETSFTARPRWVCVCLGRLILCLLLHGQLLPLHAPQVLSHRP